MSQEFENQPKTFTPAQTALLDRLAAFEADASARWLLVSLPPFWGLTTGLAEHVGIRTEADVVWVTPARRQSSPMQPLLTAMNRVPPGTKISASPVQVTVRRDDASPRRIQPIRLPLFRVEAIVCTFIGSRMSGSANLIEDVLFKPDPAARSVLLVAENVDISTVPTRPEYSGNPAFPRCFENRSAVKTIVAFSGASLPPRRDDCPRELEWRLVISESADGFCVATD